ncbi:MAG: hypothetical protein R8J84_05970 [Mariprofundales bacterium]
MSRILGINWVEGGLHFAYVVGGSVRQTWHAPESVNELAEFNLALREACREMGVKTGDQVAISYESTQMSHPLVQIPVLKLEDLEKNLFRRAEKEKVFEEAASWSWTRTYPAKDGPGVLLHLFPRPLRNALVRICEEFYLTPIRLVPLSDVMGRHIAQLASSMEGGEEYFFILVALFECQVEVLVARGDGTVLFLRDINFQWRNAAERVETEIERTMLYAKQQFGAEIHTVWLTGEGSTDLANALEKKFRSAVLADPEIDSAEGWAVSVTNLPKKLTSNMIPWYVQQRPMRRLILRLGAAFSIFLLLLTIGTVATVEYLVRTEHPFQTDQSKLLETQSEILTWQQKGAQLKRFEQRLHGYDVLGQPPAPLLMLRYLGSVQPQGVLLRQVDVRLHGRAASGRGKVHFTLQGEAGVSPDQGLDLLDQMERNLSQPPLAARMLRHGETSWQKAVLSGSADTLIKPLHFELQGETQ